MNKVLHNSKVFLKRNSSNILTCMGAAGVVATSILAVKATPKAIMLLEKAEDEKGEELTKLEMVRVAGPPYIPAIVMGASTIACIFGANAINKHSQAALMSAYALLDNAHKEYKNQVNELYGEDSDTEIKARIAKEKYETMADKVGPSEEDRELFYDFYSGRYFESTASIVQEAEYKLNRMIATQEYAYLNHYYEFLDIEPVESGWTLGWSTGSNFDRYWQTWVDFSHNNVVMDDGLECTIVSIVHEPMVDFEEYC